MNHLDLFSGIGGFALAAKWAGIETLAFCEIDPFCCKVLKKHWPDIFIFNDVRKLHIFQHVNIITAGFPCQPFSLAGKKKGKDDERYLWPEVIRITKEVKPDWIILENVPGIISHIDPILKDLENENYFWQAFLISAISVGAPHKRERLWIIANSYSTECNERTKNNETESKRSEWEKFASKIRNDISDANNITIKQTNTPSFAKSDKWHSWLRSTRQSWKNESIFNWQKDQPPIPGMDDGIPFRLDRNKSLGNAIVPQIPYIFMKMIMEIHNAN